MNIRRRRIEQWGIVLACAMSAHLAAAQTPAVKIPDLSPAAQDRFQQADVDHSGGLNRTEAVSAGYAVEDNFDAIDTDHDHIITLYEITVFVAARARDWASADTNGDGVVTRDEAAKVPSLAKIFSKADKSGQGVVRKEDLEAFSETTLYQNVDLPYVVPNIFNKKF